ncbi:hypothetical protein KR018_010842, partial [Drosophila ironensis]
IIFHLVLIFPKTISLKLCEPVTIYKTTNIECDTSPKHSANASCIVKALNWNRAVANMDVDLVGPLKNISVRTQVFKRDYTNKFQPFLVDVNINICDIIQRRNYLPYGKIIWNLVKLYSNFNHSCPLSGHLFARGVFINEKYVPVNFPLGLYKFSVRIFENFMEKPIENVGAIRFYAQAMFPVKVRRNKSRSNVYS